MPVLSTSPELTLRTRVGVLQAHHELRTVALEAFDPDQTIVRLDGIVGAQATRHTIQIGPSEHLQVPEGTRFEVQIERYPWLFLNHSCRPNTRVRGGELVALQRIEAFDELSFDYETTEWRISEPFTCRCGHCDGREVRGFRFLDRGERAQRVPLLSEHLLARLEDFQSH